MFNLIKEMFRNISKEKGMFLSSLISLTVVFILLDIFAFGILNINDVKSKLGNSNQAIVYVNTMTEDEINNFQGKLLQIDGVETIKYNSKESALETLEKELNVDLSEEENPLFDSFYIYVDRKVNAETLKENLLKNPEILELDMRTEEINKINNFTQKLDDFVIFGGIGVLIFSIILMSNITSVGIRIRRTEIRDLVASGVSGARIKLTFFLEGLLLVILSSLLGFRVFYELQKLVVQGLSMLSSNAVSSMTRQESTILYLFSLALGVIITFYLNFIGSHGYYRRKDNKKDKNAKTNKVIENTNVQENKENSN